MVTPIDLRKIAKPQALIDDEPAHRPADGLSAGHLFDLAFDDGCVQFRVIAFRHVPKCHRPSLAHQRENELGIIVGDRRKPQPLNI